MAPDGRPQVPVRAIVTIDPKRKFVRPCRIHALDPRRSLRTSLGISANWSSAFDRLGGGKITAG